MHSGGESGDMASHAGFNRQLMIFRNGPVGIVKYASPEIDAIWPLVLPWLERSLAVAPPWWRADDLKARCLSGDYILWLILLGNAPCGVALSELEQYPSALVCNVPWIGGRGMKAWLPTLQDLIERWARDAGAKYLAGAGRRGWARAAGMKEIGTILVKEL